MVAFHHLFHRRKATVVTVNANVRKEMKVRLVDQQGNAIDGFDWADCKTVSGDSLSHRVEWQGNPALPMDQPVSLEFSLHNAELYGFDLARPFPRMSTWQQTLPTDNTCRSCHSPILSAFSPIHQVKRKCPHLLEMIPSKMPPRKIPAFSPELIGERGIL